MADVVEIYGSCKRCGEQITSKGDLCTFRRQQYHKHCLPTEQEIKEMDNSYTFTLPKKRAGGPPSAND